MNTSTITDTATTMQPPTNGRLVHAMSCRDFTAFEACLADDAHLRALVPSGPFELDGAATITKRFETWFGGADDFALLEASAGSVGAKRYLRWRLRLSPPGQPERGRVAEQHLFLTGTDRIESIDLLCSGFQTQLVNRVP